MKSLPANVSALLGVKQWSKNIMAEKTEVVTKTVPRKKKPAPAYATKEDLEGIVSTMSSMAEAFQKIADKVNAEPAKPQTVEEIKHTAEVKKASPDLALVNPAWDEKAREILGDALDHCEVVYPKQGGTMFTVIIKAESSNAKEDYLAMYKSDRRTKEIGNEGIEGVEQWCKLVKENLKRGR